MTGFFCEVQQFPVREALVKLVGKKFDLTFLSNSRVKNSNLYPHFYWSENSCGFCKVDESVRDEWKMTGIASAIDFLSSSQSVYIDGFKVTKNEVFFNENTIVSSETIKHIYEAIKNLN